MYKVVGVQERSCYNYANTKSTVSENNSILKSIVGDAVLGAAA